MFGGKLINSVLKLTTENLISILKYQKKNDNQDFIFILEKFSKIFELLAVLDSKIYRLITAQKKFFNKFKVLLNYVPFLSIKFSILLLIIILKMRFSKSIKVDILIIKKQISTCIIGLIYLIKENK